MKARVLVWILAILVMSSTAMATTLTDGLYTYLKFDDATTIGGSIDSVQSENWTITDATTGVAGYFNEAYYFNSSTDRVSNTTTVGSTNMMVCIWANKSGTGGSTQEVVVGTSTWSLGEIVMHFKNTAVSNNYQIDIYGSGGGCPPYDSGVILNSSQWYLLCGVFDGTGKNVSMYLNGVLKSNTNCANSPTTFYRPKEIGRFSAYTNRWFNGTIDEFSYWNRSLSTSEILELYTVGYSYPFLANATNFSVTVTDEWNGSAINNATVMMSRKCYQEQANASTSGDGDCGLDYSGSYSFGTANWWDGNWSSYSTTDTTGIIVVKKPAYASALTLNYNMKGLNKTVSVPTQCFNQSDITFTITTTPSLANVSCSNGAEFVTIATGLDNDFREEGYTWTISYNSTNTTGNVITTSILQDSTYLWNITIFADNYFNRSILNQNVSSDLSGSSSSLHQAEVCFNASAKVSGAGVTPNNITIITTVRSTAPFCFNLSVGTYNVGAKKTGWYNQNQSFTVTALQNSTETILNMSYANLTISAKDGTTNATITTCDSNITSINWTAWPGESQTGSFNDSYYLINGTYNVTVNCSGYALNGTVANVTVAGNTNYTFTLYKSNSVRITILDEITNAPIMTNVTVRWTSNSTTWENVTNTSTLFVHNITAGTYTLLFYSTNYSTRTYTITVSESSTQTLTAYMIASTYSTIFTIKDVDTFIILENVSITMFKQVNSTWTTVESKYSDISGKAQFYYDPIGSYKFQLDKVDYTQYVFFLNPILFSTYDVYMEKTSLLNYSVDFDKLSIIYAPTQFNNNANTTFNFLISSPDGLLTTYGIKLTYPGGNCSSTGANAIGSQLSCHVNITGASVYDRVQLDYNYTTTTSGLREYTVYLPINVNTTAGATWMSNKDNTYGLGIFERLLIATIIIIFTVGIATLVGQVIPGLALGMFVYGFLCYIGFIPLWAILPSMLIGVFFITWKSGGY